MSKHIFFCCTLIIALVMVNNQAALGWGSATHSALSHITFDDPMVAPLIAGWPSDVVSDIEDWGGEPNYPWHDKQFDDIQDRAYIDGAGAPNGKDWSTLNDIVRMMYLLHSCADVGVPVGHSPAHWEPDGFTNKGKEAFLETQVNTWSTYPSVAGTTHFKHSRTGYEYDFTGTINEVVGTFYEVARDNKSWAKANLGVPGSDYNDYRAAGWNGTTIALMLQRAVFVDFVLSNYAAATIADVHYHSATNSYEFDGASSYDPDWIRWNSDGTYTRIDSNGSGGIVSWGWDFDLDGVWDLIASDGHHVTLSASELLAMGLTPNAVNWYGFCVKDDEGKWTETTTWFYMNSPGGAPEPASLSLLAVGALALVRRRSR
ncbi:MAG: PEP-CTERM sorting domain-containing protein [Phycisphaerae bacterium]|nr:PEP-CTERM sorting domain-containing protein [Phycisphaerae bacterium]